MPDLLIRDVPGDIVQTYQAKATASGKTLEQYMRDLLETNRSFTIAERVANSSAHLARYAAPLPAMTKAEMREGMSE